MADDATETSTSTGDGPDRRERLLNLLAAHDIREVGINLHTFPELIRAYFGDGPPKAGQNRRDQAVAAIPKEGRHDLRR